jgi:hypothetical protein
VAGVADPGYSWNHEGRFRNRPPSAGRTSVIIAGRSRSFRPDAEGIQRKSHQRNETHGANRTLVTDARRSCCVGIETLRAKNERVQGARTASKIERQLRPNAKRQRTGGFRCRSISVAGIVDARSCILTGTADSWRQVARADILISTS